MRDGSSESRSPEATNVGVGQGSTTDALDDLTAQSAAKIGQLEQLLPEFNTFDLLAWVSLRNLSIDPEHYHEGASGGMAFRVEYLTLLSLIVGFQEGDAGKVATPFREPFETISNLLDDVCTAPLVASFLSQSMADVSVSDPKLALLAASARNNETFIRVPGYPHHQERVVRGVFGPLSHSLTEAHGFDVEQAIALCRAIQSRGQRIIDERRAGAEDAFRELSRLAKRRRKAPVPLDELPTNITDEDLVRLSRLGDKELRLRARATTTAATLLRIGQHLSFSPNDLATEVDVPVATIERYLDALTLDFGVIESKFRLPRTVHPLKRHPLIRHGGRYLAPVPDQLLWALQPLFEKTLLADTTRHERFVHERHKWTLDESCRLFTRMMPALTLDKELGYEKPGGASGERAELDVLATYDTALFLIEVKGATIRSQAKLGVIGPFSDEMAKILEAAHAQALRAQEHLKRGGAFDRTDGTSVLLKLEDFTHVFLIAVTLEPLGYLTAQMDSTHPFTASDHDSLFTVSIHDLMVIADCLDGYPTWFPHYVSRRLRLARQGFAMAADELDLFCYYMERGLYLSGPQDFGDATNVFLGTWTDKLDEYYFREEGIRSKPAPKPRPQSTPTLLRLMERLEASDLDGRLAAMLALVDLDSKSRAEFERLRLRARMLSRRDHRPHDFSMAGTITPESWGITYATGTATQLEALDLDTYVARKRRETGVRYWILLTESDGDRATFLRIAVSGRRAE